MSIPKYNEMYRVFLECLQNEQLYSMKEMRENIATKLQLQKADLTEVLQSGKNVFAVRLNWTSTYLKKAGLVVSPKRGMVSITKEGLTVLQNPMIEIDNTYLLNYKSFQEFVNKNQEQKQNVVSPVLPEETPDDVLEQAYQKIHAHLADDLLREVMDLSPIAFEKMVIDLLLKMGYGTFPDAGRTTQASNDDGVDGIIMEDKLGFNLIYIQVKKWDLESTVGRPEIQGFVGAIAGKNGKGLFVTTAKFSKQAIEYAKKQHIILVDGKKLADLMIEYNFGVSEKKVFTIKVIDTDVWNEYDDIS